MSKQSYRLGWSQLVPIRLRSILWRPMLLGLACISFCLWSPAVAIASVHRYPEAADQVMWRSLQTLRDDSDAAWQVVFYKRLQADRTIALHLRLVGFPGVEVVRSQALCISTGSRHWTATVTEMLLPASAGEYDLQSVLAELHGTPPLELSLPVATTRSRRLIVPPFVVQEWQTVAQKSLNVTD